VTVRTPIRLLLAAPLAVLAAVLVSCGSSGAGLIPAENAGPLVADFQAVEAAAKAGNGSCSTTEAAIRRTEGDLQRLPADVDAGLHGRLQEGVSKLRELALETCAQPASQTTATGESTSPAKTAPPSTSTTGTATTTAPTSTTPPTSTTETGVVPSTPQPSGPGGGTPAPGVGGSSESPAAEAGGGGGEQGSSGGGPGEAAKNGTSGGTGSGGNGQ
jgi:hypothetical protein